jgi:hypothetical protein
MERGWKVKTETLKFKIQTAADAKLWRNLKALAKQQGRSVGQVFVDALNEFSEAQKRKDSMK